MHRTLSTLVVFSLLSTPLFAAMKEDGNSPSVAPAKEKSPLEAIVPIETYPNGNAPMPRFSVDANWPSLPDTWLLGQVSGLSIDKYDHVWILQRPNSLGKFDTGLAATPQTALCCEPAPHVIRFTPHGEVATAWGGASHAPTVDGVNQWPVNVHGLYVDPNDSVWVAGNGEGDHVVANFNFDGKFIQQFGERGKTAGNADDTTLGNPSDVFYDPNANEVVISDGYINARMVAFDAKDKKASHIWGLTAISQQAQLAKALLISLKQRSRRPKALMLKTRCLATLCTALISHQTA